MTQRSVDLTRQRLMLHGFLGVVEVVDCEKLPFETDYFDLVYFWGVIHHTPHTVEAAREIVRVCKPGGSILVMIYHRWSLLVLQAWLYYGLLKGKPFSSPSKIIGRYLESPGTKIYSRREAVGLFNGLQNLEIKTVVTRYDLRIGRRFFLPRWIRKIVPSSLGWFMVVKGIK